MENRQYSHSFPHLEKWVYNEITPTILDVEAVRTGHDPIQKKPFGITLNVWNFRDDEVHFSLLEEKFLRVQASHTERRYKNHTYAQRCTYFFYVPDDVDKNRLEVEWYDDYRVHIHERAPESFFPCIFSDAWGLTPQKRGKKDRGGESSSSGKDVASQTVSEESAEPEEVAMEVESVSKESEGTVSSQTTSGGEREPEPKASEMETEEDVSIVKEVLSQIIAGSEKESGRKEAASDIEMEEEERIIVEELLSRTDGRIKKVSDPASGDKDLSAQSTSSYVKESMPKEDSAAEEVESMSKEDSAAEEVESMSKEDSAAEEVLVEEVEKEQDIPFIGWKPQQDINRLLQNVDKKAAGRKLTPVFVNEDYRPESRLIFDEYRESQDQSIRNQMFMRNFPSMF